MPKSQEFPKVFGKITVKTGRAVKLPGYGTIEIASYSHEHNRALLVLKPVVPPAGTLLGWHDPIRGKEPDAPGIHKTHEGLVAIGAACEYRITYIDDNEWEAFAGDVGLIAGSLDDCVAACNRHEAICRKAKEMPSGISVGNGGEEAWPGIPLPAKEPAVDGVGGPQ